MGPVAQCTLIAGDGDALVNAYTGWLHQDIAATGPLDPDTAAAIGCPPLAGNRSWLLRNKAGRQWLHVVESPGAPGRDSLGSFGWMALEVLVEDVDRLAASLNGSPFTLLRPPADLDVSDRIRACQARGPAGEILYLTQVKGEVPPFELPRCRAPVDHLFIPVLSTPSREWSLAQYSAIAGTKGMSFDTKITVVNQVRGFALDRRHPVATLQLAGQALIEIDQIEGTEQLTEGLYSGMACVAFACSARPEHGAARPAAGPFAGRRVTAHRGYAGERFALVYP